MEEALNSDALEDFIYYDHRFHLLIVNYLHNDEFNQIFQRLLYLIHLTSQDALSTEAVSRELWMNIWLIITH